MDDELDNTRVRLDPEKVWARIEGTEYVTDNYNASSRLSGLVRPSAMSARQLEGLQKVEAWKVESLAVLLHCTKYDLMALEPANAPKEERKMAAPRKWTPEQEKILCENAHLGKHAVGEMLGKTAQAVKVRAQKLGVSLKVREMEAAPEQPAERAPAHDVIGEYSEPLIDALRRTAVDDAAVEEGCDAFAEAAQAEEAERLRAIADCEKYPCGQQAAPGICGMCNERVSIAEPKSRRTATVTVDVTGLEIVKAGLAAYRAELTDTHLRLIAAMVAAEDVPVTLQAAVSLEVERVRELLRGEAS